MFSIRISLCLTQLKFVKKLFHLTLENRGNFSFLRNETIGSATSRRPHWKNRSCLHSDKTRGVNEWAMPEKHRTCFYCLYVKVDWLFHQVIAQSKIIFRFDWSALDDNCDELWCSACHSACPLFFHGWDHTPPPWKCDFWAALAILSNFPFQNFYLFIYFFTQKIFHLKKCFLTFKNVFYPKFFFNELWVKQGATQCYQAFQFFDRNPHQNACLSAETSESDAKHLSWPEYHHHERHKRHHH